MVTAHLVPAADVPDQLENPVAGVGVEAGGRGKELGVCEVHVIQPAHGQRPQLRVQLLHLAPAQQVGQLVRPQSLLGVEAGGHQRQAQRQVPTADSDSQLQP